MNILRAFFTGSRVYGTPKPESDIDLVLLVDGPAFRTLKALADPITTEEEYHGIGSAGTTSVRFGNLNLIVHKNATRFDAWEEARDKCLEESPVDRKRAVAIHKAAFRRKEE